MRFALRFVLSLVVATFMPGPASAAASYVGACGIWLCLDSVSYPMFGSTMRGQFDNLAYVVDHSRELRLNTTRIVNQFPQPYKGDPEVMGRDETSWRRADNAIATLGSAGMHVTLDLSDYRNYLLAANTNPYTHDWGAYLAFVANRVNTFTGVRYADDPTIALVSFAGEVEAPKNSTHGVTTQHVTDFYARTFAQWKALDPNHLTTTGGLSYLNWNSGIDWQAIMALPQGDVCSIHTYSDGDLNTTVPMVAKYCSQLGKPWLIEEFGACRDKFFSDQSRADHYQHVYDVARANNSAGTIFWNLGPETHDHTCQINPSFPNLYATVSANAPDAAPPPPPPLAVTPPDDNVGGP